MINLKKKEKREKEQRIKERKIRTKKSKEKRKKGKKKGKRKENRKSFLFYRIYLLERSIRCPYIYKISINI